MRIQVTLRLPCWPLEYSDFSGMNQPQQANVRNVVSSRDVALPEDAIESMLDCADITVKMFGHVFGLHPILQ